MLTKPSVADFVSPVARAVLSEQKGVWRDESSAQAFPFIDGIPFLMPEPQRALARIKNQADALIGGYQMIAEKMKKDLEALSGDVLPQTLDRIVSQRKFHIARTSFLERLLAPIRSLTSVAAKPEELYQDAQGALALVNNYPNIIRDWGDDQTESQKQFAALRAILPAGQRYGKVLVLGAGACRLSFDFHQAGLSDQILCADINPVLLLSARLLLEGNQLDVPYVTYVPKDAASLGGKTLCRAQDKLRPGFSVVFCDAYNLPFSDEKFDAVITPWLIDILPNPLEDLVAEIHRVLRVGGDWINTGTLNMQLPDSSKNYFMPEIEELASRSGLKLQEARQDELPYLNFSDSAHKRFERITSFRAKKQS